MKQQTAVEYLFEQLWETPKDKFTWNAILEKAKEMEQQRLDGYTIACENGIMCEIYGSSSSSFRGVVQIFNSDGTPLKCGDKQY
jgi:hypothetical protein